MPARLRKATLAVHVGVSVGWIGAVIAYIALDAVVATSRDAPAIRAAYVSMDLIAKNAILPLAVLALTTGLLISLGTKWGLFRHYWVVVSLIMTTIATVILFAELQTISHYAALAANPETPAGDVLELPNTLPHSVGGTAVLLVVFVLNMYKPRGMTRYGWRKEQARKVANAQH